MHVSRHEYSSWYFRHDAAIWVPFSDPTISARRVDMDSVESRVP
jgi:hypothetical protein